MKAAWYTEPGDARRVLVVGELETPSPGPGEVRVRVAVSGVNPSDVKTRRRPLAFPRVIPHSDGAGVIDAVGAEVAPSRLGQRVWLWNGQWQRPMGTAAQYIVVPEAQAVWLPEHVDLAAGACLGIPVLTACQAVRMLGHVAGKTILVTGAGSSVGHYVTQIAAQQGARVIGTAGSAARLANATAAGASAVIDYRQEPVAARIRALTDDRGVDAVIDMDLSSTAAYVRDGALAPHGTLVCYGSNQADDVPLPFRMLLYRSIAVRFFLIYDLLPADREAVLADVNALLAHDRLVHHVAARFALDDIAAAHEAVEGGKLVGNVVVDLP